MLTAGQRNALLNHTDEANWPIVATLVADAMNGDASLLKLLGSGPALCVHMLIPAEDDQKDPSLVILIDQTHHRPAVLVIGDKDEAAKEYSEIIAFAWSMHRTGRLPAHIDDGLTRWREREAREAKAKSRGARSSVRRPAAKRLQQRGL